MMEKRTDNGRSLHLPDFKARVQRFRTSSRNGMFGVAELIAVGCSLLILMVALLSYFYFLVPARSRLQTLQLERTRLQNLTRDSEQTVLKGLDTRAMIDKIASSLDDFENGRLLSANQGRMGLYEELNQLIRKNGLRNTSGPSYTPLEPVGSKKSTAGSKSANSKWQSVYPGISVTLTVEGTYQNLRRFIRNVEASNHFIIINAIELEKATETNTPVAAEGSPTAPPRGTLVSLRMDMATYFQRFGGESGAPTQ
jgi:Tfp pilus assembly protein PilO